MTVDLLETPRRDLAGRRRWSRRRTVADQDRIFGPDDVGVLSRLLSHLLITGAVIPVLALASSDLAIATGVVLYGHIVCDLLWDRWRLDHHADEADSIDELVRALR